jgi:hypothetical protein
MTYNVSRKTNPYCIPENKRPAPFPEEQEDDSKVRKISTELSAITESVSPESSKMTLFPKADSVHGLQKYQEASHKIPALIASIGKLNSELQCSPNLAELLSKKLLTHLLPQMFLRDSPDILKKEICKISDDFDANVEKSYDLFFVIASRVRAFIHIRDSSNGAEKKGAFRTFNKAIEFDDFNVRLAAQLELTHIKKAHSSLCLMEEPDFASDYVVQILHISQSPEHHIVYCEYMNGGDLHSFLKKYPLSFEEKLEIVRDALNGIHDMHKNGYMHRDIKASNFLIQTEDKICENMSSPKVVKTKIGDLDTLIKEDDPRAHNTDDFSKYCPVLAGTLGYIPRESMVNDKRTKSDDIYAFGKTLKEDVFPEIFAKKDPSPKESAFIELINKLCADKAVDRLNSEAALKELEKTLEMLGQ